MKDQEYYNLVAIAAAVVVVGAFVAGFAGAQMASPQAASSPQGGATSGQADYIYLTINSNPDLAPAGSDQYDPANFTVPSHMLVVFTVTNYDTGENPIAPQFAQVRGAVGGVEYLNGSDTGVPSVPSSVVAHTFTILHGAYAGFNVPMPAAADTTPTVVVFEAYFNTTGPVTWQCMAPCDGASMASLGYMMGTMTVE